MFNDNQIAILNQELDGSRVKVREKGNINLSYLEGFDIIETANKIFGYGNWSYSITKLEQVSQEQNQNQNFVVCYKAIVNVILHDIEHLKQIYREDVGTGTGIAKTLADAHEGASKEAVTDALKRALRTLGNQFGLSLYDKTKNHQSSDNNKQYKQPQNQPIQNHTPQDYSQLTNLGLTVMQEGQNSIVVGENIFEKTNAIKAHGFKWDGASKTWYKPLAQQAA